MSWYKKDNPQIVKGATPEKPKGKENYVQVPTSSPIYISSSPVKHNTNVPSLTTKLEESKQRELEAKRQAIRQHKDFPVIRKRFYYLSESDIFKGFVKGKGNLRLITQWLETNFDRNESLRKEEEERKRRREEEEKIRQKNMEEKMKREYEAREERIRQQQQQQQENDTKHADYSEEDESPVKLKGRARVKRLPDMSPTKEAEVSTKVQITKPKQSILDKYKFKPKTQPTLDNFGRLESLPKKRKLVRASHVEENNSKDATSLKSKFSFNENIPKLKHSVMTEIESIVNDKEEEDDGIVADDDLERLEEKIKENRKRAKQQQQTLQQKVINISDDDEDLLEEDDDSDSMSEEEEAVSVGITSIDAKILEFINNAPVTDLIDIAGVEPAVADVVASQRPFSTIYDIAENDFLLPDEVPNKRKRKKLGMKIIEHTESNLKGYRAVDSLIKSCSEYGDFISKQMKAWGVTVTGEEGELNMVDIDPLDDGDVEVIQDSQSEEDEDDEVVITRQKKGGLKYIKHKPLLLAEDITLSNYQQVGINWMNLLYSNKLSCILADEMGLGKTCQVISFMAHLKQMEEPGPHLVIVPSSTIENWLREFAKFCPDIKVQAYYGSMKDREELRYELSTDSDHEVLVTTYNLASGSSADFKFLKSQNFNVIVYDEGHLLKNSSSDRYAKLMRLKAKFRLLLTGTPLQNNLKELVSLLAFMLPKLFEEKKEDLIGLFNQKSSSFSATSSNNKSRSATPTDYNPLLSQQAIKKAKTMMTPFVLRRRKDQVLQYLPAKCHEILYCDLTESQTKIYQDYLSEARKARDERERRRLMDRKQADLEYKNNPIPSSTNVIMQLRKACLHPLLFRTHYDDAKLQKMAKAIMNEPEYVEANQQYIFEDMQVMNDFELNRLCERFPVTLKSYVLPEEEFLSSGKVIQLREILDKIINQRGEKVLIFSLFTQVLDILEKILTLFKYKFLRLDGSTSVDTRQDTIDAFYDDETIPVFLLSTKAGGFGINLVAANNVIIFDQSFNPHDDKQAEDRAHRVGQTKEVTVYKLIVNKTVEENMLMIAKNKLQLDSSISSDGSDDSKFEENAASLFEKLLFEESV
ncbi:uncharacterized protein SPAPADRAFT_54135 [Spathaspora passalidarum NRRL Y-27907]|uniref:DNA helicase n=1 Tax=Spathaspora passalidarum (strain NRRL Y-27907 / 11-Y1) TaxID=619300 RepID=G3AJF8_SPAPN|nr:uncharacterized protein SPAPADRAFT_54135 [Spathaspora passalidarum NRRL Y-27907]EGW33861.1 hypothetical protein SPAPADRAFT_54135 [Spathaspora passalidarum NRRL Y-27907]